MNLEWLVAHGDPKIIRHPTVVMPPDSKSQPAEPSDAFSWPLTPRWPGPSPSPRFADLLWYKLASYKFVLSKLCLGSSAAWRRRLVCAPACPACRYFLLMLVIFITSQAIIPNHTGEQQTREELLASQHARLMHTACRGFCFEGHEGLCRRTMTGGAGAHLTLQVQLSEARQLDASIPIRGSPSCSLCAS